MDSSLFERAIERHTASLAKARTQLEVYTDLFNHFKFIDGCDLCDSEYKACANALIEAILTKIDPINY